MKKTTLSLFALGSLAVLTAGVACESYVAPPEPELEGIQRGVLSDVNAPLTIRFSKPIDPSTLRVKVVKLEPDLEGDLSDENNDPVPLVPLYSHDPDEGDKLGKSELIDDDQSFKITPLARFPVGTKLALLVEPGVATKDGVATTARRRLTFSYSFDCKGGRGSTVLRGGPYFLLLDVEQPLGTQIQLFGWFDVDPKTGLFRGQFTNADRNLDRSRCGGKCSGALVCRTLPAEDCVVPSLRAGGEDEFPDYVVNVTPPTGYSFTATGCAEDQPDGTVAFRTAPADLIVQQPAVSIKALEIIASFARSPDGVLHASGGGAADQVFLGTTPLGKAKGTLRGRSLDAKQAPPEIPKPPAPTDGGL